MDRLQKIKESKRKNKGSYRRWYFPNNSFVFFIDVMRRKTFLHSENVLCEGD